MAWARPPAAPPTATTSSRPSGRGCLPRPANSRCPVNSSNRSTSLSTMWSIFSHVGVEGHVIHASASQMRAARAPAPGAGGFPHSGFRSRSWPAFHRPYPIAGRAVSWPARPNLVHSKSALRRALHRAAALLCSATFLGSTALGRTAMGGRRAAPTGALPGDRRGDGNGREAAGNHEHGSDGWLVRLPENPPDDGTPHQPAVLSGWHEYPGMRTEWHAFGNSLASTLRARLLAEISPVTGRRWTTNV